MAVSSLPSKLSRQGLVFVTLMAIASQVEQVNAQELELGREDVFLSGQTRIAPEIVPHTSADQSTYPSGAVPSHDKDELANLQSFERLMLSAEAALARGEAVESVSSFEHAASFFDEVPDAEIGQVRALLQSGEYRLALATAYRLVGEHGQLHTDVPQRTGRHMGALDTQALLAWLMFIGGQQQAAHKQLDGLLGKYPDSPALRDVRARMRAVAGERVYARPSDLALRLDPYVYGAPLTPDAGQLHARASGVILADGRIMTSISALPAGMNTLWVRNGLGQIRSASLEHIDQASGLVVLRPAEPFSAVPGVRVDPQMRVFPGSPCYVVEFPLPGMEQPSWPVLWAGFLGRANPQSGHIDLLLDLPAGSRGGAAFDSYGRLLGFVPPSDRLSAGLGKKTDRIVPVTAMSALLSSGNEAAGGTADPAQRLTMETVYELAMSAMVTVLGTD
jgi:hypothetical protein